MYTFKQAVGWLSILWGLLAAGDIVDMLDPNITTFDFTLRTVRAALAIFLAGRAFRQWRKM